MTKISELPAATTIAGSEPLAIVQDNATKKVTIDVLTSKKSNVEANQSTGTVVAFTTDTIYGTKATPETGNITVSYTGAKLGVTVLIFHEAGTEPTYPASFEKISGDYDTAKTNRIMCMYTGNSEADYFITQPE